MSGCSDAPAPVAPTPAFTSEEQAFAAAAQTYRNYIDALNQVDLSDPATFEEVYRWTTGDANADARKTFAQMHADGWTMRGASIPTLLAEASLTNVSAPLLRIAVCLDVSEVVAVDESGNSVVSPDRRDVQSMLITFKRSTVSPTGLQIETITGREGAPDCSFD